MRSLWKQAILEDLWSCFRSDRLWFRKLYVSLKTSEANLKRSYISSLGCSTFMEATCRFGNKKVPVKEIICLLKHTLHPSALSVVGRAGYQFKAVITSLPLSPRQSKHVLHPLSPKPSISLSSLSLLQDVQLVVITHPVTKNITMLLDHSAPDPPRTYPATSPYTSLRRYCRGAILT